MPVLNGSKAVESLIILHRNYNYNMAKRELIEQREQSQMHLDFAESRKKKSKAQYIQANKDWQPLQSKRRGEPAKGNREWLRPGKRFFANFNFTVLDEAPVTIGDDCFIGPNVSIYTACHSTDPVERNSRREWAEPVTIGDNVWIGGSVTILPGVTIGDNVTIGAGSVVTKDIPSNSIAVGNPCKVIKAL